jgi:hypothetical protein
MSWLKRLRGKRLKSTDGSPDEVFASSQPGPTPTITADLKGKNPAQNTIAAGGQRVCGLITPHECGLNLLSGYTRPRPKLGICKD